MESLQVHDESSLSFDVFINFRGEDTRKSIVGHLHRALKDRGIFAFIDSKDLWKGEDIEPQLMKAIKGSKLFIVIFSKRYTESKWCLQELVQILDCHRNNHHQIILPVFYNVTASDVKNQKGSFCILPQTPDEEVPTTLTKWKEALRAVGDKSGIVFNDEDESELVSSVVQEAWKRLNSVLTLTAAKHPVGVQSRLQSLLSNTGSKDVQFLLICGVGGIGKTTIAKAVYNHIFKNFSKSCFLGDITNQASREGIASLQEKLLFKMLQEEIKICSSGEGSTLIKERLGKLDILLILDDVGDRTQLDALAGDLNWFGTGSRIFITSRDHSLLSKVPINNRKIYEPEELDKEESLQLFGSCAFPTGNIPNEYMQLSVDIVGTTGGLPLALEVLGSDLSYTNDKRVWESMLRMLKQIPHKDIYEKLKISYDSLQEDEKAMFLDAACCFTGWKEEEVLYIWEACGFESKYRIEVLKRKSLLKIGEYNELLMHDQIRDMGRRISYNENPREPHKHSRLWSRDDCIRVINGGRGNEMVEVITELGYDWRDILVESHMEKTNKLSNLFRGNEMVEGISTALRDNLKEACCLHTTSFKKMPKLRLLQVGRATLEGSLQSLPSSLRCLDWRGCPLNKLPMSFNHDEIVMLDLSGGRFTKAWNDDGLVNKPSKLLSRKRKKEQRQLFPRLKVLKLSDCLELTDFYGFPRLERLYLDGCWSLVNLHESIGQFEKLIHLDLGGCSQLKKLPNSICKSSSLQKLILSRCLSLEVLADFSRFTRLEELCLADCGFLVYLDKSIGEVQTLIHLDLGGCSGLEKLPNSICKLSSLQKLILSRCLSLKVFPDFSGFTRLEELHLADCRSVVYLDESIGEVQTLIRLDLGGCSRLERLPNSICKLSSLQKLILSGCVSLNEFLESTGDLKESLVELHLEKTNISSLPDDFVECKKLKVFNVDDAQLLKWSSVGRLVAGSTAEVFRGMVKTSYNEISELSEANHSCVLTNGDDWETCREGQKQIWIRLGDNINARSTQRFLIPDVPHIYWSSSSSSTSSTRSLRLIMHVSFECPRLDDLDPSHGKVRRLDLDPINGKVRIRMKIEACIRSLEVEILLKVVCMRTQLKEGRDIVYIHAFKGIDWFGIPLEAGDIIHISNVNIEKWRMMYWGPSNSVPPSQVNLFLVKENTNLEMFYSQFRADRWPAQGFIEFLRF